MKHLLAFGGLLGLLVATSLAMSACGIYGWPHFVLGAVVGVPLGKIVVDWMSTR